MKKGSASARNLHFSNFQPKNEGAAIFYSPKKIQQARELQKQQEDTKLQEAALKADRKLQKQLQKEEKQHLIEQRKQQRVQK